MNIQIKEITTFGEDSEVKITIHDPHNPFLQLLNFSTEQTDITKDISLILIIKTKKINSEEDRKKFTNNITSEIKNDFEGFFKYHFTNKKNDKMSKSKGNVITPDEVVFGVQSLNENYEFRYLHKDIIKGKVVKRWVVLDHTTIPIWKDRDHFYYTSKRIGKIPVYLCEKENPHPCIFEINGRLNTQHFNL